MGIEKGPRISRRDILAGVGATALTMVPGVDALGAQMEKKPQLGREILNLRKDLKHGGRYEKALQHSSLLTDQLLTEMKDRLTRVGNELREMHFNRRTVDPSVSAYVYSEQIPGLTTRWIDTGRVINVGGKVVPLKIFSNQFVVESRGAKYEVIPHHGIVGSPQEAKYSR